MWLKVAAIAALCVTDAAAQGMPMVMQNCTTQVGNEVFRYCFTTPLVPPTTVYWNPADGDPLAINFAFEGMAAGDPLGQVWRAVGFSNGAPNPMVNGMPNVVMGCVEAEAPETPRSFINSAQGADFQISGRTPPEVVAMGAQGLLAYNQEINGNMCSIRFRRPVVLANNPMQSLGDRDQAVIVARGVDGDSAMIGNHLTAGNLPNTNARAFLTVNFANPANLVPGNPDMMTTSNNMPAETMPGDASALSASMTIIPAIVYSIYVALW